MAFAVAGVLAGMGGLSGGAFGKGKPLTPGEETAGNRLSYPAILVNATSSITPFFTVAEGELGKTYSYACDKIEMLDQWEYPNTSCVDNLTNPTVYYTEEQCKALDAKCAGLPVSRVYWQKQELNNWSAQATAVPGGTTPTILPVKVRRVDWGDSIEVVNWNETSVLRVETQPFVDLNLDPLAEISQLPPLVTQTQLGFQMWHVSGQGITEQWGVRVQDGVTMGLPYLYQSAYAIVNGGTAQLYLSKLFREAADDSELACPNPEGDAGAVYPADYPFDDRTWTQGVGWSNSCNLPIVAYTLEQSVSGKFVHGYNWRMRELSNPLPPATCVDNSWQKTGWWRLTFVPNGGNTKMAFQDGAAISAPDLPAAAPTDLTALLAAEEEEETEGTLYTPVVDSLLKADGSAGNNLTYIDICIVKKARGGGGGGQGGRQ